MITGRWMITCLILGWVASQRPAGLWIDPSLGFPKSQGTWHWWEIIKQNHKNHIKLYYAFKKQYAEIIHKGLILTHYIHIGPKWQCLPQTRTRTSSSQSKTWQLQTRRNTPRSPLNTLKRRLQQKQASRWRIWPFANCFIISLSNYIFLRERKNIISFWETISKVDGQSGSSSDMALLQVDKKSNINKKFNWNGWKRVG